MSATRILSGYEPAAVLSFFEDICAIPHVSGDERAIADYVENFAKTRGLACYRDSVHNVFVKLPATEGHESAPAVMLQGHTDMVGEKTADSTHNFATDGLKLKVDANGWISATDTTLGGDDGIAIAYALALLEEETPHPALELFFTVDEETGMDGAIGFDPAWLQGRKLLNLDSEEEGQMIVSAAGGCNATATLPVTRERCEGAVYRITVEGLQGGHSGAEIHRGLGNANMILAKILSGLRCRLIEFCGGNKGNAVPRSASALVVLDQPVEGEALTALFRREYGEREPELTVTVTTATALRQMTKECSEQAVALLSTLPDGVQAWSASIEGLVETSLNCGIVTTTEEALTVLTSLRSMVNTEREALFARVKTLMERCGAAVKKDSEYPAWEYREDSPLRETVCRCYRKQTGKDMKVIALHAGLECGLLSEKLPGLDCVSLGPDMKDIHTPRERISVSSVERTGQLLKEILKEL